MTNLQTAQTLEAIFRPLNEAEEKFKPKEVFATGNLALLSSGVRVSLIGSREASTEGLARARRLARLLVKQGITIVSGLAKGIDRAAHEGAIEAKGRTIAVIGTPLDSYYPKENQQLQDLIASEHLLLSQFAPGSPVTPKNFPIRNRLMALISDATVIVEAQEKSGSLHQGWEAIRLARPLYILESSVNNPALSWPAKFLEYGAQILSDDSFDALIDSVPGPVQSEVNATLSF